LLFAPYLAYYIDRWDGEIDQKICLVKKLIARFCREYF
jgi:hypothetical protein